MPAQPTSPGKPGSLDRLAIPIPEAAKKLSVSRAHLYREIERGRLKTVKLGKRRLVRVVDLYSYLEANIEAPRLSTESVKP